MRAAIKLNDRVIERHYHSRLGQQLAITAALRIAKVSIFLALKVSSRFCILPFILLKPILTCKFHEKLRESVSRVKCN